MTRGRGTASIVASPVLVGAVTTLVVIVSVFLAYNANQGLPFVPTYDVKAQLPGGQRMARKRMPVAERQRETGTSWLVPPPTVPDNRPVTGALPGPERVLTWPGGPQGRRR